MLPLGNGLESMRCNRGEQACEQACDAETLALGVIMCHYEAALLLGVIMCDYIYMCN